MGPSKHGRWTLGLAAAAGVCLGLGGCAGFWDDITSRDRTWSAKIKEVFVTPDPLLVLRDSVDGDARAKALRALREPKEYGGNDEEQDFIITLVTKAAASERQPLCRLAAIQKLGTFKDPRALKGLQDAFYNAGDFAPEIATRLQCQALTALGETGNPDVARFLVDALKEPPAERSDLAQQRNDRCIAAARALARFKDYQTTEALAGVLKSDKEDLALRGCAHESLQTVTGKYLPPEYKAWDDFLHPDAKTLAAQKPRKLQLASWFFE